MTVAVQQNFRRPGAQRQIELRREFVEQHARLGHRSRFLLLLAAQQRRSVFFDRGKTTRLAEQDLFAALGDREQPLDQLRGMLRAPLQQSLRDQRTSAAARPHHVHAAAAALQHLERRDADLRIVVIGEGVVE